MRAATEIGEMANRQILILRETINRRMPIHNMESRINLLNLLSLCSVAATGAMLAIKILLQTLAIPAIKAMSDNPTEMPILHGLILMPMLMATSIAWLSQLEIKLLRSRIPDHTIETSTTALPIIEVVLEKAAKNSAVLSLTSMFALTVGGAFTKTVLSLTCMLAFQFKSNPDLLNLAIIELTPEPHSSKAKILKAASITAVIGLSCIIGFKAITTLMDSGSMGLSQ